MSKLYKCDINDIKKEMDILKERLVLSKKYEYESFFDSLYKLNNIYMYLTNHNYVSKKISKQYIHRFNVAHNFLEKNSNKLLDNYIDNKELLFSLSDDLCNLIFDNLCDEDYENHIFYNKKIICENEAMEIIYDFLKKYHSNSIELFDYLKEKRRFYNSNSFNENNVIGECIINYGMEPLIIVNNDHYTIDNISTLLHEFGHAVEHKKMANKYSHNQFEKYFTSSFYTEVNSIKFEKQFLNFCVQENIYKDDAIDNIIEFYNLATTAFTELIIFSMLDDDLLYNYNYEKYDNEFLNKFLGKEFDNVDFNDICLIDSIRYSIGYIFSIYLSNLSFEDEEKYNKIKQLFNSIKFDNFNIDTLKLLEINEKSLTTPILNDIKLIKKRTN